jgi:hypothetical protein
VYELSGGVFALALVFAVDPVQAEEAAKTVIVGLMQNRQVGLTCGACTQY